MDYVDVWGALRNQSVSFKQIENPLVTCTCPRDLRARTVLSICELSNMHGFS